LWNLEFGPQNLSGFLLALVGSGFIIGLWFFLIWVLG
jgi:hypothetical protein